MKKSVFIGLVVFVIIAVSVILYANGMEKNVLKNPPPIKRDISNQIKQVEVGSVAIITCTNDAFCNDFNQCTNDVCYRGICINNLNYGGKCLLVTEGKKTGICRVVDDWSGKIECVGCKSGGDCTPEGGSKECVECNSYGSCDYRDGIGCGGIGRKTDGICQYGYCK